MQPRAKGPTSSQPRAKRGTSAALGNRPKRAKPRRGVIVPRLAIAPRPQWYYARLVKTPANKTEAAAHKVEPRRPRRIPSAKPSLWSRMEDLVFDDETLPRDISSNKEYMRGYGKNRADR